MQSQIEWSQIERPWASGPLVIEVIVIFLAERCLTGRSCLVARWLTTSALWESESRPEATRLLESLERDRS
jgi:hypothetical protein